jgi:hypothetical protein
MRLTRILVIVCGSLMVLAAGAVQADVPLRPAPLEAYGVLCGAAPGEVELTTASMHTREVTYTGVVLSGDERVAGTLTVLLTITRELDRGTASYSGRILVRPTALGDKGTWEGVFGGEVARPDKWQNVSDMGVDLLHRRALLVRRNVAAPVRSARPQEARVVRRLLRGTGELEGMRLVFDHRVNEGVPPSEATLPAGCTADYERWQGLIVDVRR